MTAREEWIRRHRLARLEARSARLVNEIRRRVADLHAEVDELEKAGT